MFLTVWFILAHVLPLVSI